MLIIIMLKYSFTINYYCLKTYQRVIASSTALVRACPKCNDPVTLGGGIIMMNFPFGLSSNTLFFYN